jgi:hypothetical protein
MEWGVVGYQYGWSVFGRRPDSPTGWEYPRRGCIVQESGLWYAAECDMYGGREALAGKPPYGRAALKDAVRVLFPRPSKYRYRLTT